ncbi:MAG: hypothetical protein D6805_02945 [Planctomycetota bacterium]|nr:MAG: hypothetical protein D6805_02945 [Planctomycetota bacterium]
MEESKNSPSIFQNTNLEAVESKILVPIRFEITTPQDTDHQKGVWLAGSGPPLGYWEPKGLLLKRVQPNLYVREAMFLKGSLIFFKVTQGSWSTVEVDRFGYDIEDRALVVKEPATVSVQVERFAKNGARARPSTKDEHVVDLGWFGKNILGENRLVQVHIPPDYEQHPGRFYPVVYMFDGQNLFDASIAFQGQEWAADKIHDQLYNEGKIRPFFIVGIHHANQRDRFFTPIYDEKLGSGGKLDLLERVIREEIEPALLGRYRVLAQAEHRGVMGSSLGGLAAFHLGWRYPERYRLIGALSPSFWWANYYTFDLISSDTSPPRPLKIWLDMGTRESPYRHRPIITVSKVAHCLKEKGYDVRLYIDKDATHSERAWRRRLPLVFTYFFGNSD